MITKNDTVCKSFPEGRQALFHAKLELNAENVYMKINNTKKLSFRSKHKIPDTNDFIAFVLVK